MPHTIADTPLTRLNRALIMVTRTEAIARAHNRGCWKGGVNTGQIADQWVAEARQLGATDAQILTAQNNS